MVSPQENVLADPESQQYHCCFSHGGLQVMNVVVNYIFSAVNAFMVFLYMFEVGSATTGGSLFLLKQNKQLPER